MGWGPLNPCIPCLRTLSTFTDWCSIPTPDIGTISLKCWFMAPVTVIGRLYWVWVPHDSQPQCDSGYCCPRDGWAALCTYRHQQAELARTAMGCLVPLDREPHLAMGLMSFLLHKVSPWCVFMDGASLNVHFLSCRLSTLVVVFPGPS